MYIKYDFRLVDKVQKSQNTTGKGLFRLLTVLV